MVGEHVVMLCDRAVRVLLRVAGDGVVVKDSDRVSFPVNDGERVGVAAVCDLGLQGQDRGRAMGTHPVPGNPYHSV